MTKNQAKCYIYWNLHKRCFSAKRNGKVFAHFRNARVLNPEFRVSAAGRERVRREGTKNVHAYIVCESYHYMIYPDNVMGSGEFLKFMPEVASKLKRASYNPYRDETFVDNTGKALYNARIVELTTRTGITSDTVKVPVIYITKEANEPVQS